MTSLLCQQTGLEHSALTKKGNMKKQQSKVTKGIRRGPHGLGSLGFFRIVNEIMAQSKVD